MKYHEFILTDKKITAEDTYLYTLTPRKDPLQFKPGQYVFIKNPAYATSHEAHPFSIASSPTDIPLEFCIKTFGNWTKKLEKTPLGSHLEISEAQGNFTWHTSILHAVFLLGGIGISPIMSMLRFMRDEKIRPESLIMLYGNRTPAAAAYSKELAEIKKSLPTLKIVDIFSHLPENDPYTGYRGFITREIVEREVNLTLEPTFYYIGPPVFIEKMEEILETLHIPKDKRKKEDFAEVTIK